jgi:hypothetical protein
MKRTITYASRHFKAGYAFGGGDVKNGHDLLLMALSGMSRR